tara:strand:- start:276 stop:1304 length:1029 start_codon:yes stop_codon:yes gene_type:complete
MNSIYNNNKSQQKNIENKNRIRTNSYNESIHLSLILASNIFIPRTKGYGTNVIVNSFHKRTDFERISCITPPLDTARDFPLFSIVVSKFQREKTSSFILTEFEIYKALDIKREKIITEGFYENNFKKLKDSEVTLMETNKNGEVIKSYSTSLIIDFDWDSEAECFMFQMDNIFLEFFIEEFQYERIYADKFKSLKNGHAKALYLYLETMKFKNQRWVSFNEDTQFKERFCKNINRNADKNSSLKRALERLKAKGMIYEYLRYKSQNENNPLCKIYRDKESFDFDTLDRNKEKIQENFDRLEKNKKLIDDHNESIGKIVPIPPEVAKPTYFEQIFDWENEHPF